MLLKICVCLFLATILVAVHSAPVLDRAKLRFKIGARSLPDRDAGFGTIDPYVDIYYTELGGGSETKLGRTDTIEDNENPDWGNVFEFDWDRSKTQRWYMKVYDHDAWREDDGGGKVWIDVNDYVDRGQFLETHLHKKTGYLIVKSADPQAPAPGATPGQLPVPHGSPDKQTLKFRLAATDLPNKDVGIGTTDPYVELYSTEGISGSPTKFARSATLSSNRNPSWGETFEFSYDRSKDQYWYFKVYDDDTLRSDDGAGKVWVSVNDYVAKGQVMTLTLSKKSLLTKRATLTITRADGPVGAPSAPTDTQQNFGFIQPEYQPTQPNSGLKQPQQQYFTPAPISVQDPTPKPTIFLGGAQLKFKLSARGLEDRDVIGTSDPYVKIYVLQDGSSVETELGRTSQKDDEENPNWDEVFEFAYERNRHPRWRFLVLDQDNNRKDDELGDVTFDVQDVLATSGDYTVNLKRGTLTISMI